jgi:hypothetical protein
MLMLARERDQVLIAEHSAIMPYRQERVQVLRALTSVTFMFCL